MIKKAQVAIFVVIAVFLVAVFIIYYIVSSEKEDVVFEIDCQIDSDCIPIKDTGNPCCHPNSCAQKSEAPDCSDVFCTAVCQPGSLDCGQGSCKCINSKCAAVFE